MAKAALPSLFGRSDMEYIPEGWRYRETHTEVRGWDVPEVLEIYKRKWPDFAAVVNGTGPLGVSHESFVITGTDTACHNMVMSFAYVASLAARGGDALSILDWGGGIGHYYLLARSLLPDLTIDYHCRDLPLFTRHGASLFSDQHFHEDDSCLDRSYGLVMASGSLHFSQKWPDVLARLAKATGRYLYLTRVPTSFDTASFVFIQRPYRYGYDTEYLGWCLNRETLLQEARHCGLMLVREFVLGDPVIHKAPGEVRDWGYLFRPICDPSPPSPSRHSARDESARASRRGDHRREGR